MESIQKLFFNMNNDNQNNTKSMSVAVEKGYEDNPEDDLQIVPENKGQHSPFIAGYHASNRMNSIDTLQHVNGNPYTEATPKASSNGNGHIQMSNVKVHHNVVRPESPALSSISSFNTNANNRKRSTSIQLDDTIHYVKGKGILACQKDVNVAPDEFAAGCKLLQACALGDLPSIHALLQLRPQHINFRDYDRRTALHVAASEGKLDIVLTLVERYNGAINRSDRWGGSPLDDAHRHRQSEVIQYLRSKGASTGSTDLTTNLITAAAAGDIDDVEVLLSDVNATNAPASASTSSKAISPLKKNTKIDINGGDYDGRTALHLASAAGHVRVVRVLIDKGANVNVIDNWGAHPLDDAIRMSRVQCIRLLRSHDAKSTAGNGQNHFGDRGNDGNFKSKEDKNLKVEFSELDVIDKIGSGAFGEIFKCKWRGTLVAAKCIKNTKIVEVFREDDNQTTRSITETRGSKRSITETRGSKNKTRGRKKEKEEGMNAEEVADALRDFREETSILRTLRHPNICMLLGYSATENFEVMISELMRCSLLDVFTSHIINNTRMSKKKQILYAQQLARGMNYLHKCTPPVIHRDLKPANLLIDVSGALKISDFGLAKVRPDIKNMETDQFRMTGETGSYRFMAPEVFRHENYTETVDVYSFAMIFYYLLAGRPPWQELNGLKAVIKAATEADRPITERSWDSQLSGLMQRCWDENPTFRPPFSEILQELEDYSSEFLLIAYCTC